jgi:GH25 family lysozyme M1 (1,4-beta-N-acetylmuramidase)
VTLLDLSHFQADAGPVDYAAVKTRVSGAYIKLSQATGYVDPAWRQHYDGLAGIPRGGYHFCGRMDNLGHVTYQAPEAEANAFAAQLGKASWELRPVVDIEAPGADPAWLKTFLTALRQASGLRRLRVYTSHALLTGPLTPSSWIDPDVDIWAARYNPTLGFDHPQLVLWQHTQSGRVPGITGPVDLSVELRGWTPRTDLTPATPDPVPLSPQESEPMIAIPLNVTPEGNFRATVMAEAGSSSAVIAKAWITLGSTWGDTSFTVTALDNQGRVMPGGLRGTVRNNRQTGVPVPDGCVMATIEGRTTTGAVPAAALVTQAK